MTGEEWRPVVGWEAHYEVSNFGNLRRLGRTRIRKLTVVNGYLTTGFYHPRKGARVHRVVAKAFIPNPENLPVINHIDCNKKNNRVENLEWCTVAHNNAHAIANGRKPKRFGFRAPTAKLSDDEVREIRRLGSTKTRRELGAQYGVSYSSIKAVLKFEYYRDVR